MSSKQHFGLLQSKKTQKPKKQHLIIQRFLLLWCFGVLQIIFIMHYIIIKLSMQDADNSLHGLCDF